MEGIVYAATCVGAIAASLAATPLVMALSHRWGVIDLPNQRLASSRPMLRLGGVVIAVSMFATALVALANLGIELDRRHLVVAVAALSVLAVGVLDDLVGVSAKFRLLAIIAAACVVCGIGVRINSINLHGYHAIPLGHFAWPVTILWLAGITVSINFIDGLGGLAAGIAAIACGVVAFIACSDGQTDLAIISLAMLGSLIGFLYFNFDQSTVFLGDSGGMFVGFALASMCLMQTPAAAMTSRLMLPLLALSVPIIDTVLMLIRRGVIHRGSFFHSERGHIHHRLQDAGLCPRHAVLILYGVSLLAASVGLLARLNQGWPILAGLALLLPLLIGLFHMAGSTRVRETVAAIRRNRAIGRESKQCERAFQQLQGHFREARNFEQWWDVVRRAGDALDFLKITIPLTRRDGSKYVLQWIHEKDYGHRVEFIEATVPILQRRTGQYVRAQIEIAAPTFLESAGQRIAMFSRLMGDYSLQFLPETRRVRSRGPAGEKTKTPATKTNGNGHGPAGNPLLGEPDNTTPPADLGFAKIGPILRLINPGVEVRSLPAATADRPAQAPPVRDLDNLRVAVVHDFLYCYAGAERVLEQILKVFPQADLFSLFDFLPEDQRGFLMNKPSTTTFIQKLPFARSRHRMYLPLMPVAVEQLDVSKYDIIISSSYLAAKGVLTGPDQLHISYCHTPARFAWDLQNQYLGDRGLVAGLKSLIPRLIFHYIRSWDVRSSNGVDVFATNSDYVSRRIEKVYRRRAETIYPPVDVERFTLGGEREDFYLTACRLVPYKRVDLIVEAFSKMPSRRLIVVGDGPEFEKIRAKAGPNVKMVGQQPFEKLKQYMQLARAFVFAAEEDFGIVPVEAQACGTPVIAYGRGGVTESVIADQTGSFYDEQTPESLIAAVEKFERHAEWSHELIRENAMRFSAARFRTELRDFVQLEWNGFVDQRLESAVGGTGRRSAEAEEFMAALVKELPASEEDETKHEPRYSLVQREGRKS